MRKHTRYKKAVIDCSNDEVITEQSHKKEVDINQIVKKHGVDLIQKTAALQQFVYDDNPTNDFQETMNMIIKAQDTFESMPSALRKKFDNDPAQFMDFVHNEENKEQMFDLGLAIRPEENKPLEVVIKGNAEPEPSPAAQI